jgi:hypothetical protein
MVPTHTHGVYYLPVNPPAYCFTAYPQQVGSFLNREKPVLRFWHLYLLKQKACKNTRKGRPVRLGILQALVSILWRVRASNSILPQLAVKRKGLRRFFCVQIQASCT